MLTISRFLVTGTLLVAGAFALAACGGGDDDDGGDENTPAAQATSDAGDEESTPAPSGNGNGDGDLGELRDAAEQYRNATYQATYEVTGSGAEGIQSMTMYRDGADRSRIDLTGTSEGEDFEGSIITTPEQSLFCTSGSGLEGLPGVEGGAEGTCLDTGAGANPFVPDVGALVPEIDDEGITVVSTEDREIAGRDATCYTVRDAVNEESTICVDDEGVMLSAESTTDGQTFTLTATDVSEDVSDSDFEPPYDVVDIPGFPGAQ